VLTRRSVLFGGLGALTACTRPKAKGFSGYAFIANSEGGAIAAVDLEVFAVARHIRVDGAPTAVVAREKRARVYALTPENGCVHEIRTGNLTFASKLQVCRSAITMRLAPSHRNLYVLCRDPRKLVALAFEPMRVDWELPLPADPTDFDVSPDGSLLAISYGPAHALSFIDLAHRQAFPLVRNTGEIGLVRFQQKKESRELIAANVSERMLSVYDAPTRRLIVHLPLAVRPDHLCFNADDGQLFVTGEGMDAVVVVYPYYTPQIGERSPEMLTPESRAVVAAELPRLAKKFPKLLVNPGVAQAFLHPPSSPSDCLFAKMSANYSADLETRVEPCVFGGSPDCSQCGCSVSSGLHWIRGEKVVGPLRVGHFVETSIAIGTLVNRLRRRAVRPSRWRPGATPVDPKQELVKIET